MQQIKPNIRKTQKKVKFQNKVEGTFVGISITYYIVDPCHQLLPQ